MGERKTTIKRKGRKMEKEYCKRKKTYANMPTMKKFIV